MNVADKAIEVLTRTEDGSRLSPEHLALIERVLGPYVTEDQEVAFEKLYAQVTSGQYRQHFLFGIEHLTPDHQGHVYWRGTCVEHFSHTDAKSVRASAEDLARRCRLLEEMGFPVDGRTVISQEILEAPADTPWLDALRSYHTFFVRDDTVKVVLYRRSGNREAVALEKREGKIVMDVYPTACDAYHAIVNQGYESAETEGSYVRIATFLERSGLTPEEIRNTIH